MTDDVPAAPAAGSTLQRATDGRSRVALFDARAWRSLGAWDEAPAYVLIALFIAVFIAEMTGSGPADWGLSAQALAEGRWQTIPAHMAAHAGLMHMLMNGSFLLGVTPVVMIRFGVGPSGWLRYAGLFLVSGLLGAAFYLALHPTGAVPMVGASGAICGLWGAAARIGPEGEILPIRSGQVWGQVKAFAKMNLVLFSLLFVLVWISGGEGGLAWEAHLGGFLFGLFALPWLAPRPAPAEARP